MDDFARIQAALRSQTYETAFSRMYGGTGDAASRYERLALLHRERFASLEDLRFYSAPGRTEILGNHTDHNRGKVLAAAVTMDTVAAVTPSEDNVIRLSSEGYGTFCVDASDLASREDERGTSAAILRGVAARLRERGRPVGGFCATVDSRVASGSGLSSSAAFEVLVVSILSDLYAGRLSGLEMARVAQYAENRYFGKPCGLMDQTASAVGGLVAIDFGGEEPEIDALSYDFAAEGYDIVVVSPGGSHDHLTPEYAAIPSEMKAVAAALGGAALRDVSAEIMVASMGALRGKMPDRALLRALHFFGENARVGTAVTALRNKDLPTFFKQMVASGESSWKLLQNVYVGGALDQSLALALALAERLLPDGAWRVHGGGFAGTILTFVPHVRLEEFTRAMNGVFGPLACTVLGIRSVGAGRVDAMGTGGAAQ